MKLLKLDTPKQIAEISYLETPTVTSNNIDTIDISVVDKHSCVILVGTTIDHSPKQKSPITELIRIDEINAADLYCTHSLSTGYSRPLTY